MLQQPSSANSDRAALRYKNDSSGTVTQIKSEAESVRAQEGSCGRLLRGGPARGCLVSAISTHHRAHPLTMAAWLLSIYLSMCCCCIFIIINTIIPSPQKPSADECGKFGKLWKEFGRALKLGIVEDNNNR